MLDCYYEQMAQPELAKGIAENLTEDDIRGENESLGEVCHDLTFPKEKDGLSLNWESSDESVIGNDGDYRYDGLEEQTITVTAIAMHDDQEIYRKSFDVTVKSVGKTELDAFNAMEIPNADHIKGNITLPVQGIAGSPIIWESSEEDVISVEAQGDVPGGIVTRQEEDVKVTLTATLMQGSGDVSREFELTVKKKPSLDATTDYVFAYYKGYGEGQEKIYFAASRDGLTWGEMNGGDPILESTLGTTGLRDPYLFRSPEGDKFYLLATDLSAYQGNGVVSRNGSQAVMVWESDDLVHWGEQRMVEVAAGIDAGCAWAPEACYDETTQEYLLFWASTTPADNYGKQQVYYCKTRDFHTFTEPKLGSKARTA